MSPATAHITISGAGSSDATAIAGWRSVITPSIDTLKRLAGTTENEFLHIGAQMQDFYQRSQEITSLANRMVEAVSGPQAQTVIERLREMMGDMEAYLAGTRSQSRENCTMLERILELLNHLTEPLDGFQKMYKILRMLSTSTKIESSRLGEVGLGFQTLAMDVEKLSHMVNEKSASILGDRQMLAGMIGDTLRTVRASEDAQDRELSTTLAGASHTLEELISVNDRCTSFATMISSVSGEVSGNISEVVSSMQMHDMTRQQFEHIVEALECLAARMQGIPTDAAANGDCRHLVTEAGDVCELQSAQLRHAASELCSAVRSIVENLRDVAGKQARMTSETLATTGIADAATGGSFVGAISSDMATVTAVLAKCALADQEMSATLKKVADTMQEVTGFVTDIEEIGSEIDLIALNSQIKAAHTGREGAALGVLAEAIKRLSVEAVTQTSAVSEALLQINRVTERLFGEASQEQDHLGAKVATMEAETEQILAALGAMNDELVSLLAGLNDKVSALAERIEEATGTMDAHERVAGMADEVMAILDGIVREARELEPASAEFKNNLRHMEERYTMESERHIHEAIARKRGIALAITTPQGAAPAAADTASEFGDNVDLF
ncbi:methyl-accepting chemotaxis protein [Geobacter sp. FeAm09]|uniref:methyl-accepting chemotaxis protein n=1 Tax=Geobacter sp. FeAm09 TaxID=2597769 RepID=UPI0011F080E4|nr:methyl-accepting chemotaxis protein [Geobacter sp. FeAm09]QEM67995.1 methyl-accepting chemotaxis protein [Geobacter sp. FeAm09]